MDRRKFLASGAAVAGAIATNRLGVADTMGTAGEPAMPQVDLNRHRFGVNYTPSHNWWFCWNDWNADPIKRDLDAIAALGADHMRTDAGVAIFSAQSEVGEPGASRSAGSADRVDGRAASRCAGDGVHRAVERMVFSAAVQSAVGWVLYRSDDVGRAGALCSRAGADHEAASRM